MGTFCAAEVSNTTNQRSFVLNWNSPGIVWLWDLVGMKLVISVPNTLLLCESVNFYTDDVISELSDLSPSQYA